MSDVFSTKRRSEIMLKIRSSGNKDTELRFIEILKQGRITGWRRGWPLFGKPDFTFPKQRLVVFVDGCFWHGCPKCYRQPRSNVAYWKAKIRRNLRRDAQVKRQLNRHGWKVVRFWECKLKNPWLVASRLRKLLTPKL